VPSRTDLDSEPLEKLPSAAPGRLRRLLPPLTAFLLGVLVWDLVVRFGLVPPFLLPSPATLAARLVESRALLWPNTVATAGAATAGFLLALAFGILVAVPIIWFRMFDAAVTPLLVLVQVTPKIAVAPLLVVYLGFGAMPKIALAFLISFFPIVLNTTLGLRSAPAELVELLRSLRATKLQTFSKIRFPTALPYIVEGAKVAITLAVIGTIIGEFSAGSQGVGFVIISASSRLNVPLAFAGIVAASVVGIVLYVAVDKVGAFVVRHAGRTAER
jgi:NitT/TauT family transport system permease protein